MVTAERLIELLRLEPLGFEGGFYRQTYLSAASTVGPDGEARAGATAIYYLLTPSSRSMMHRLRSDEVYHFYLGDPVDLLLIDPDGRPRSVRLGPDVLGGEVNQLVVPAGTWQGSSLVPGGAYALMGTTMAPGFHLADFELGRRSELVERYPEVAERLRALTPEVLETPELELTAATRDLLVAEGRGVEALLAGLGAAGAEAWPPPTRTEAARAQALRSLASAPDRLSWGDWYVVQRSDRALIGTVGFSGPPGPGGEARLRVRVDPGPAVEAVGALLERCGASCRAVVAEVEPASGLGRRLIEGLAFEPGQGRVVKRLADD